MHIRENNTLRELLADIRSDADTFRLLVLGSGMSGILPESAYRIRRPLARAVTEGHPMIGGVARLPGGLALVLAGRKHLYESADRTFSSGLLEQVLAQGPSEALFLSAAGGLSPWLRTGDLLLHTDYLSAFPLRPSGAGAVEECRQRRGWRPDASGVARMLDRASESGIPLRQGVYAWVSGPSYETRAEIRMLRRAGADVVGMSAYPEIRAAARHGVPALGLSLITNQLTDVERVPLDHLEVTAASDAGADQLRQVVECW